MERKMGKKHEVWFPNPETGYPFSARGGFAGGVEKVVGFQRVTIKPHNRAWKGRKNSLLLCALYCAPRRRSRRMSQSGSDPEPTQAVEAAPGSKAKGVRKAKVAPPKVAEAAADPRVKQAVVAVDLEVPLVKCRIDSDLSRGQIRPVDNLVVEEYADSLRVTPPAVPHRVLLWQADTLGV